MNVLKSVLVISVAAVAAAYPGGVVVIEYGPDGPAWHNQFYMYSNLFEVERRAKGAGSQ